MRHRRQPRIPVTKTPSAARTVVGGIFVFKARKIITLSVRAERNGVEILKKTE